jgi:uncharacterized membrane protein
MPDFETYFIVKWLHVLFMALGGGAAMIILILVGFEDGREDLKGMTSILWKRTAVWAFRLAVVLGAVLLVLRFRMGDHPFEARYLHLKLALVVLLLAMSELSGRALARARRGAAILAFLLFLMVTFVTVNRDAFGTMHHAARPSGGAITGAVEQGPQQVP